MAPTIGKVVKQKEEIETGRVDITEHLRKNDRSKNRSISNNSLLANSTEMSDAIRTTNGYQKTGDLITLPYTESAIVNSELEYSIY